MDNGPDSPLNLNNDDILGLDDVVSQELLKTSLSKLGRMILQIGIDVTLVRAEVQEAKQALTNVKTKLDCFETADTGFNRDEDVVSSINSASDKSVIFVVGKIGDTEFPYRVTESFNFKLHSESRQRSLIKLIIEDIHSLLSLAQMTRTGKRKNTGEAAVEAIGDLDDDTINTAIPSSTIAIIMAACRLRFPPRSDSTERELLVYDGAIRTNISSIIQYNKTKHNNGGKWPAPKRKKTAGVPLIAGHNIISTSKPSYFDD